MSSLNLHFSILMKKAYFLINRNNGGAPNQRFECRLGIPRSPRRTMDNRKLVTKTIQCIS